MNWRKSEKYHGGVVFAAIKFQKKEVIPVQSENDIQPANGAARERWHWGI